MTNYNDIIDLPHHISPTRPRMPREERAAQFMPFAALTGHDDAIREEARTTAARIELDDALLEQIGQKIQWLVDHQDRHAEVTVTWFCPDKNKKKGGGRYQKDSGTIRRVNEYNRCLCMDNGKNIPFTDIVGLNIADENSI